MHECMQFRATYQPSDSALDFPCACAERLPRAESARRTSKGPFMLKLLLGCLACAAFAQSSAADAAPPPQQITRVGSVPSASGPAEYFTGRVRIAPVYAANSDINTSGALVTFEPGARSAWHTHPLGQVLIVTSGVGRVQRWGGPVEEIRAGDVVWTPPGVKHWHGASPTTAMSHIAIQEHLDGKAVEWMEKVTDEQYGRRPG